MNSSYDVLVTGSSGHLGTALMLSLPANGYKPFGIDIIEAPTTNQVGSINSAGFLSSILFGSGIRHIIHTATLHKPHIESHTKQHFIDTNISGTLIILEAAATLADQLKSFVFISTTSTFGDALSSELGSPAAWIDESVVPQPKNIYGITKIAAEDLCLLFHKRTRLPIIVLKLSRFFPEEDDDESRRNAMADDNLKVLELAHRRVDIEDAVRACVCAMQRASTIMWGKYIISAPSLFANDETTLSALDRNAGDLVQRLHPDSKAVFADRNWTFLSRFDRVYDSSKAIRELGWHPQHTFWAVLKRLQAGQDWRSKLLRAIGKRGYHEVTTGIYTKRD